MVWFNVSRQARTIEQEEMGAEMQQKLPQTNQPRNTTNKLPQPNPNPETNAKRTWEEEDATNLEYFDPSDKNNGEIKMTEEVNDANFYI